MIYVKLLLRILLAAILALIFAASAITHKYGPFSGRVVDVDTGEPIEGAVVLLCFDTKMYTPGGPVSYFADALEVLTDAKGEFFLPAHRITLFRFPHYWDTRWSALVFKPGYGSFPRHKRSYRTNEGPGAIPENQFVTINLPKLQTKEERIRSIDDPDYYLLLIPPEKRKELFRLVTIEEIEVGLIPDPSRKR